MDRILITGGAGFIGSTLALRLQEEYPSCEIVALDNLHRNGSELNKKRLEQRGISFMLGDVRNPAVFGKDAFDVVIDAAAEPSVLAGSHGDGAYVVDTNLIGTLHTLEAARRWNAAFLFLSTSRVYPIHRLRQIRLRQTDERFEMEEKQNVPGVAVDGVAEDFPVDGSKTLYGATKYAAEVMVAEFADHYSLRTIINRCGVVAGPWQMGRVDQGVVALWVASHHFGHPLQYIGFEGRQVRDCLHVSDLGDLVCRQIAQRNTWCGATYNVGGGRPISFSLIELTRTCRTILGRAIEVGSTSLERPGDIPLYVTDARRVMRQFGWRPTRSVEMIVQDTAEWVAANEQRLSSIFR